MTEQKWVEMLRNFQGCVKKSAILPKCQSVYCIYIHSIFKEMMEETDYREKTLVKVIEECKKRLANLDEYDYEIVDLESEFRFALEKKEREKNGRIADVQTYFSPGARFIMGRGEYLRFVIGERNILYAMDPDGNEVLTFTSPGCKIEAQQMRNLIRQPFPTLTPGLARLMDENDTIPSIYGYDYFLCGRDIVLCSPETICKQVLDIIRCQGIDVDALPLDKAWLIYEPEYDTKEWPKLSDYRFVKEFGADLYWEQIYPLLL